MKINIENKDVVRFDQLDNGDIFSNEKNGIRGDENLL